MAMKTDFVAWSLSAFQQSPKDLPWPKLAQGSTDGAGSPEYFYISPTYVQDNSREFQCGSADDNTSGIQLLKQFANNPSTNGGVLNENDFGPVYGQSTPAGDFIIGRAEIPPGDGLVSRLPDPSPGREEILPGDGLVGRLPDPNPGREEILPGDGLVSRLPDPNPGREEILPGDGLVSRLPDPSSSGADSRSPDCPAPTLPTGGIDGGALRGNDMILPVVTADERSPDCPSPSLPTGGIDGGALRGSEMILPVSPFAADLEQQYAADRDYPFPMPVDPFIAILEEWTAAATSHDPDLISLFGARHPDFFLGDTTPYVW
jgi:hypothetical protein